MASNTASNPTNLTPATPASFESALAELDALVQALENGKLPLEQALASYERGAELIRYCQKTLQGAEKKIQVLEAGLLQDYAPAQPTEDD